MNKYTKGKWAAEFDGEYWNVILADAEGIDYGIVGCEGLYRCDGSDEANARLIAAAPELLEALQLMERNSLRADWPEDIYSAMVDAIAKATGESA